MTMQQNVLITFVGKNDPYFLGLVDGEDQFGPVLTLVRERQFAHVILLGTPDSVQNTEDTRAALASRFGNVDVEVRSLRLNDPSDYAAIMAVLRRELRQVRASFPRARFHVSVASGTPQIHASWVVLLQEGEFAAHILDVSLARSGFFESPFIAEVDLASLGDTEAAEEGFAAYAFSSMDLSRPVLEQAFQALPEPSLCVEPKSEGSALSHATLENARKKLGIVGEHPRMRELLERVEIAAPTDMCVLVLGETGTGKELVAKLIHNLSDRAAAPFIPLNCGAIPKELVESTLFGHDEGAFTGATRNQRGKFEEADGGTLFLDELGELPLGTQVKLLRVIEDGIIQPLGAKASKRVNVRVVAATNQDLHEAKSRGLFRADLYYRIGTVQLCVPPLRERASDIPGIALHLLEDINARLRRPKRFSRDALARLKTCAWPGNVRDLRNTLTQSAMFCRNDVIEAEDLIVVDAPFGPDGRATLPEPRPGFDLNDYLSDVRRQLFLRALELAEGSQSKAARLLGVSPQAVHSFLNETAK